MANEAFSKGNPGISLIHPEADTTKIRILLDKGDAWRQKNSDSALYYYNLAIIRTDSALVTFQGFKLMQGALICQKIHAMHSIGSVELNRGNIEKAQEKLKQSFELIRKEQKSDYDYETIRKLSFAEGTYMNIMGLVFREKGSLDSSEYYLHRALRIRENLNDSIGIAGTLNNLGLIAEQKGAFFKALDFYHGATEINQKKNNLSWLASNYNNLGSVYQELGETEKAIRYLERSIEIKKILGNKIGTGISLNTLAVLYKDIGSYEKAQEFVSDAIRIFSELNHKSYMVRAKLNEGNILLRQYNYGEALKVFNEVAYFHENAGNSLGLAESYNNIGTCFEYLNNYSKAMEYFKKAETISKEKGYMNELLSHYINIGKVYSKLNKQDSAGHYFQKAKIVSENTGVMSKLLILDGHLIKHYVLARNSEGVVKSAAMLINRLPSFLTNTFSYLSQSDKEQYLQSLSIVQNTMNVASVKFSKSKPELAGLMFNNVLLKKGILLSSTTDVLRKICMANDSSLTGKFEEWRKQKKMYSGLSDQKKIDKSTLDSIGKSIDLMEAELSSLSGIFSKTKDFFGKKWDDIRKILKPGEAVIEFVDVNAEPEMGFDSTFYYALIITYQCKYPQLVRLCSETELQKTISGSGKGFNPQTCMKLYFLVWKPLEKYINTCDKIMYSPNGLLHKVPFASLFDKNNKPIFLKYEMHHFLSLRNLFRGKPTKNNKEIALFGGIDYGSNSTGSGSYWKYLPETEKEVDLIAEKALAHSWKCDAKKGTFATENEFISTAEKSNHSIYHIATHGFYFSKKDTFEKNCTNKFKCSANPMIRSGLVFSGANSDWDAANSFSSNDGVLTGYDLSGIYFSSAKLVVLSACETGVGEIYNDEGVIGLQRAFLMAGVEKLIVSLWKIPDKATREMMELFYDNYFDTLDIFTSFCRARKQMSLNYPPEIYGAFILLE